MPHSGDMPEPEDLITAPEAGVILGKSARTVQRMIPDKLTPVRKLPGPNGAWLFCRADVEALTEQAS